MQLNTDWLVKNKIIHLSIQGDPITDDLKLVSSTINDFINKSDALFVHILIDQSKLGSMPISLNILTKALEFFKHPRLGWFIIYGNDDQIKKFISSMLTSITKARHRRFGTLEESLQFLVLMDTTLPTVQDMLDSAS